VRVSERPPRGGQQAQPPLPHVQTWGAGCKGWLSPGRGVGGAGVGVVVCGRVYMWVESADGRVSWLAGGSSHGGSSVGKVADKGVSALELDGHDARLHLNGVIFGRPPINAYHRMEVVVRRQLGEQGLVTGHVRFLDGMLTWGGVIGMHSLVSGDDIVDVDQVAAEMVSPALFRGHGPGKEGGVYTEVRATTRCRASISLWTSCGSSWVVMCWRSKLP